MTQYKELYRNGAQNGNIADGGTEYFCLDTSDYEGKRKYGSFNVLTILQSGTGSYNVMLDGLTTRKYSIPSTGSFTIKAEEGIFFDFVVIENTSGVQIDAGDISLQWAKAIPLGAL